MIKMICFDLDGTLCDTIYDIADSVNLAIEKYGFKNNSYDDYRKYVGDGLKELLLRSMHIRAENECFYDVRSEYIKNYTKLRTNKTKPFDGMLEVLKELKDKGYLLSVITNKLDDDSNAIINKLFPNIFDYASGEVDGVAKKPLRDKLDIMREKYNLKSEEVIYVGDSHVDAIFAENADVKYFLFEYGYENKDRLHSYKPIAFLNSAKELLNYL